MMFNFLILLSYTINIFVLYHANALNWHPLASLFVVSVISIIHTLASYVLTSGVYNAIRGSK